MNDPRVTRATEQLDLFARVLPGLTANLRIRAQYFREVLEFSDISKQEYWALDYREQRKVFRAFRKHAGSLDMWLSTKSDDDLRKIIA